MALVPPPVHPLDHGRSILHYTRTVTFPLFMALHPVRQSDGSRALLSIFGFLLAELTWGQTKLNTLFAPDEGVELPLDNQPDPTPPILHLYDYTHSISRNLCIFFEKLWELSGSFKVESESQHEKHLERKFQQTHQVIKELKAIARELERATMKEALPWNSFAGVWTAFLGFNLEGTPLAVLDPDFARRFERRRRTVLQLPPTVVPQLYSIAHQIHRSSHLHSLFDWKLLTQKLSLRQQKRTGLEYPRVIKHS